MTMKRQSLKKCRLFFAAALCGLAVITAGCGELKPDSLNGVYSDGNQVYVCKYDTEVMMGNKEKLYKVTVYADIGRAYKGKEIYSRSEWIVNPKDGNFYAQNVFTEAKMKFGQFKDNKMIITKKDGLWAMEVGEYPKTKKPIPNQNVLEYNGWKASGEAAHDRATTFGPKK